MKCYIGIDLGSTTTKAVLLDEAGEILGRGITNSRSNYATASAVAKQEARTDARMTLFRREFDNAVVDGNPDAVMEGEVVPERVSGKLQDLLRRKSQVLTLERFLLEC